MAQGGIWNLKEVLEQNPVSPEEVLNKGYEESLRRTSLVQGNRGSVLLQQAQPYTTPPFARS